MQPWTARLIPRSQEVAEISTAQKITAKVEWKLPGEGLQALTGIIVPKL